MSDPESARRGPRLRFAGGLWILALATTASRIGAEALSDLEAPGEHPQDPVAQAPAAPPPAHKGISLAPAPAVISESETAPVSDMAPVPLAQMPNAEPSPTAEVPPPPLAAAAKTKPLSREEKPIVDSPAPLPTLENLELTLDRLQGLNKTQRLRLISLVQELRGRHDQAYLTFKDIPKEEENQDWYVLRDLLLSDKLGLEEEAAEQAERVKRRFLRENLAVSKCLLCSTVKRFGVYEEVAASLEVGRQVLIYVEVSGVAQSMKGGERAKKSGADESKEKSHRATGTYASELRASFTVFSAEGREVFAMREPQIFPYDSQSVLRDYFIWMRWTPTLDPGNYKLVFRVEDRIAGVHANGQVVFSISSPAFETKGPG